MAMKPALKFFLFSLMIGFASCATQGPGTYTSPAYEAKVFSIEENYQRMGNSPLPIHGGKALTHAGTVELVVIEGTPSLTNGKRSIAFSLRLYGEYGSNLRMAATGPECCVKQVDDHNVNFRPSGSLQFFRLSLNQESGALTIRTLSGEVDGLTVRALVTKMW